MKQFKKWMFAAIILCGTATMLTSCLFEDNPSTSSGPSQRELIPKIISLLMSVWLC